MKGFCVFITVILLAMVATVALADLPERVLLPTDTKHISGPHGAQFPAGCPSEQLWLSHWIPSLGVRDADQFTVYSVGFSDPIGAQGASLGYVGGRLAIDAGQSGPPPRPRVSYSGASGPWTIAQGSSVVQLFNGDGTPMQGTWCGGGVYNMWAFSIGVFSSGNSTSTLWVSSSNGQMSMVGVWGWKFQAAQ